MNARPFVVGAIVLAGLATGAVPATAGPIPFQPCSLPLNPPDLPPPCEAYFVYGADPNPATQAIFKQDATSLQSIFSSMGWATTLYGPGEPAGQLPQALGAMNFRAASYRLEFLYYSGHGGGANGGGAADTNGDESVPVDPIPPGFGPGDDFDETLAYGAAGEAMTDDQVGAIIRSIQSEQFKGSIVAGAIEACHSGGMIDGSSDIKAYQGLPTAWMTSTTEWECGDVGGPFGPLTRDLLNNLTLADPFDGYDDLVNWFRRAGNAGHTENQTYTLTTFIGEDSVREYYPPPVPEPGTLLLVAPALIGLAAYRYRRRR